MKSPFSKITTTTTNRNQTATNFSIIPHPPPHFFNPALFKSFILSFSLPAASPTSEWF